MHSVHAGSMHPLRAFHAPHHSFSDVEPMTAELAGRPSAMVTAHPGHNFLRQTAPVLLVTDMATIPLYLLAALSHQGPKAVLPVPTHTRVI